MTATEKLKVLIEGLLLLSKMQVEHELLSHAAQQQQNNQDITEIERSEREFIRRLVNDYLHFKIYGPKIRNTIDEIQERGEINASRVNRLQSATSYASSDSNNNELRTRSGSLSPLSPPHTEESFQKTSKVLRKVSIELERSNSIFFDNVCENLNLQGGSPQLKFRHVSEEVLRDDALNWGRVVSLFTFGGKLAEWFWNQNEEDKIEEVEEWLAESLSSKSSWIEEHGGWENFADKFDKEQNNQFNWLKPGLLMCVGVSIAALFSLRN